MMNIVSARQLFNEVSATLGYSMYDRVRYRDHDYNRHAYCVVGMAVVMAGPMTSTVRLVISIGVNRKTAEMRHSRLELVDAGLVEADDRAPECFDSFGYALKPKEAIELAKG